MDMETVIMNSMCDVSLDIFDTLDENNIECDMSPINILNISDTKNIKCDIKSVESEKIGTTSGVFKLTTSLIGYKVVKCYSSKNLDMYYAFAQISIPVGAIIVVPCYKYNSLKLNDDLRTNIIKIEEIYKRYESDVCVNYYYNQYPYSEKYEVGKTYNSKLDTTKLENACREGLHFMLSKELLIDNDYMIS